MSDQVQLSAYSETIENFIRSERYDQAIALCQHILCYFPKHIATYRQMAEANLKKGDLHSAAELFRRVLSADPENYVAYAGLAIIFERQALIDEAVWHLERAVELNPGHSGIHNELLRLYGERDGRPQTRLRLTPGALARLYVREGLFAQAAQEFRAILSQAPRRLDARLALAETLWYASQMRDSTQVCQEILQALPYCLKANLILGKALQESGADEAETYLQCAQALDPTNRVAQEMFGEQSPLHPAEVFVPEYVERSAPGPAAEVAPPATEQAPAEGFEDWFAEGSDESEAGGIGESNRFGVPSESPIEGMATTPRTAPFQGWPPIEEQPAQVTPAQEDWTSSSSSWVSQIQVASEPAEAPSAGSPSAGSPSAETLSTDQAWPGGREASPEIQSRPPTPRPELPPWLQSDFGPATPLQPAPQPIVPSAPSLPPWLIEFQKLHQVDDSTEPATEKAKPEASSELLPKWMAKPSEIGETVTPPPPEKESRSSEAWPSWESVPPPAVGEQASLSAEQTGVADQLPEGQAVLAPEPTETGMPGWLAASEVQTTPVTEEEPQVKLPDWLEMARVQAAAEGTDTTPSTEDKTRPQIPDWLKGLQEEIPQEPAFRADDERAAEEVGGQEEQPLRTAQARDELEEAKTTLALSQEEIAARSGAAAESGLVAESSAYLQGGASPEGDAWATETEAEPAEVESGGESEPIVLMEEAADRELYGDGTAAPASVAKESLAMESLDELAAGEAEVAAEEAEPMPPATGAPAPVEANAREESPPSESVRRRRDPKGYSHLVQARTHCQDNRLGEALKEYDYVVQHSPRLVNTVIEDLEELIRRREVPLEAHRILGDAYTRADRLTDALERYRFVLERVS